MYLENPFFAWPHYESLTSTLRVLDHYGMPFAALPLYALPPSGRSCLSSTVTYPPTTRSPWSYADPSPPSWQDYGYSTEPSKVPLNDQLFRLIIVPALVASIQLVAMCIAYWAFTQRKSCDCCYDTAGVPNCPSAPPDLPTRPSPSPL